MNPRLLRPLATGFNPEAISGLAEWWDASDASTLLLNTGAVEEWTSKSTAGTVASQSIANNRPTTTQVNGRTALLFDGSNDGLDFAGVARTDETWFIACEQLSNQSTLKTFINDAASGHGINTNLVSSARNIDTSWGNSTIGVGRIVVLNVAGNEPLPASILSVARSAAAGIYLRRNGEQIGTATTSFSTTIQRIGYYSSSLFQLNGWIGEIICYDRALDATELLRVERYLGGKWGVTTA